MIIASPYQDFPVDVLGLFKVPPATVVQLVGAMVPLLVAVAVKRYAHPAVKVATNLVATAVAASIALLATNDGHYDFAAFWQAFMDALLANVVAYFVLWRKTLVLAIEERLGDVGIGGDALEPVVGPVAATPDNTVVTVAPGADTTATTGTSTSASGVSIVRTGSAFDDGSDAPPLIDPSRPDGL